MFAGLKCFKPRYDAPLTRSGGFDGQSASIETGIFGDTTLLPIMSFACHFLLQIAFDDMKSYVFEQHLIHYVTAAMKSDLHSPSKEMQLF